jgi:MtrB/PioB family decaheme-associated outer membrane protein
MRRQGSICVGVTLLLGALLAAESGVIWAAEPTWKDNLPFRFTGEIETGLQIVEERGNSPTFDEYRDLEDTDRDGWGHLFQVPYIRLQTEDRARTHYVEIGGTDLTRMDANYYANYRMYNYFGFNFEFDRIPHVFAHNAQTIYNEFSDGIFTIADPVRRTALANALNAVSAVSTPAQRNAVQAAVNNLLRPTKLAFQTDDFKFGLNWLPLPALELSAGYNITFRDGTIPWGTVIGSPGSNVVELAAPRDERIHEAKFNAEYARDWYQARFNYTFSLFENDVNKIEWTNPCGTGAGCGNASALGRYSTMPENYAHTFSGAAGFNLPWWNTRITAGGSYALWRQDETFLPYGTVPVGTTGNRTDAGATSPDARIDVLLANVNVSTRPLRNVTANARYRYYELNNDTPEHSFTNVLSGGGDTAPATGVHTSEPLAFRKQNAGADVSWRIFRPLTAKIGYDYEHWNRDHREVKGTDEHIVKGALDYKPLNWILARATYSHGVRTIGGDGYTPLGGNATSLPQFRKFDQADRTRQKVDLFLQVTPIDTLSISGSFYGQRDNYFNTTFGLQEAEAYGYSADVEWTPIERLSLYAGYAHDDYKSDEQSCAIPGAGVCNPVNTFFVQPRDLLDTVHAGFTVDVLPKLLDVSFGYRFAFGRSKQGTAGVPGVAGGSATVPDPGNPADVPTTENKFHVINVVVRYFLTPNWILKLGYQYERYEEKDFTTDGIGPSLAALPTPVLSAADARSIILGAQHPNYEAHIGAFSVTYRF